jgi:hypothetical protein
MLQQRSRYTYAAVAAALGCLAYCRWPSYDGTENDSEYSCGNVDVTYITEDEEDEEDEDDDGADNDGNTATADADNNNSNTATANADNDEEWGQFVILS